MRKFLKPSIVLLVLMGSCLVGTGQQAFGEGLKIGYVDLDRIREGFAKYQEALSRIKSVKEKEQVNLDEMSADFDKNVKQYELKDGLFDEKQKNEALEDLRKKWNILNEFKAGKDQELEKKSRDELAPLIEKIKATIKEVAAANGYHLIFKESDLAYCDDRLNITDKVLEALNKE
jgi:outer membrane protein